MPPGCVHRRQHLLALGDLALVDPHFVQPQRVLLSFWTSVTVSRAPDADVMVPVSAI